jgi:hypothetical protein
MRPAHFVSCVALSTAFLAACSDKDAGTGDSTVCEPGEQQACACPGGTEGAQACRDDGSGWEQCICPGDDGGDDGGDTTDDGSTGGGGTGGGSTTSGTGPGDDGGTETGGTGDTGDGGTTGGGDTTSGGGDPCNPPGVILQNDGFVNGQQVGFQGGFIVDECWASVYEPEAGHYPFTIEGATMLVGGSFDQAAFLIAVYEVDGSNMPTTELGQGEIAIDGSQDRCAHVDFNSLLLDAGTIESGKFAIVVCHTLHAGYPSIARDGDNTITGNLNWIKASGIGWVQSQTFGLQGDWIMRAIIDPQ